MMTEHKKHRQFHRQETAARELQRCKAAHIYRVAFCNDCYYWRWVKLR